ncbi:MAG: 3-phosphoshikimate 1-carboxyvinyltransferase [Clostridia bacterium]|nr:3-phosphoshikimate 1-carboxyvinyltransferase [Clostridia bacterium]
MNITIAKPPVGGEIRAITSKSAAHRLLICAALADGETELTCTDISKDISATVDCLNALGARITRVDGGFHIVPVSRDRLPEQAVCRCGESGSTLRFLIPVAAALGVDTAFIPEGRLPERPLSPLYETLVSHGVSLSEQGSVPFFVKGTLPAGTYTIAADVSSQFISGLVFSLPLTDGESRIRLTGKFESRSYVDMTVNAVKKFGIDIDFLDNEYIINTDSVYRTAGQVTAEGDWSNAAFWLCAGACAHAPITVTGLDFDSLQGDKAVIDLLARFGARMDIDRDNGRCTVYPSALRGIDIDASNIPDLVPVLATVACAAEGTTNIYNAVRLRIKESDRLMTVRTLLTALGGDVAETADGLRIHGAALVGGACDSFNDHRIAMSAAVASLQCKQPVTVTNASAVEKSYPSFWTDFERLGGVLIKE